MYHIKDNVAQVIGALYAPMFQNRVRHRSKLVQGKFPLLQESLAALKGFSDLKGKPSLIDAYLNWRVEKSDQEKASKWLKAAYQSLKENRWVEVEGRDSRINLSNLASVDLLPNSKKLNPETEVLIRNEAGDVEKNDIFFKAWLWNTLRFYRTTSGMDRR